MKKRVLLGMLVMLGGLTGCGGQVTPADVAQQETVLIETQAVETTETDADTSTEETEETSVELGVAPGEEVVAEQDSKELVAGTFAASDMELTVQGVTLRVGDDFLPNVDAIGEAEIVEGQACLEGGYDTNYYYGGEELVVYTVAQSGKQIIYDIYITSPAYATAKGAMIGTTSKDDLYEMYGEATESIGATWKYSVAGSEVSMNFTFDAEGVLETIDILDNGING